MIFPQLGKSESLKPLTSQQPPREHFGLVRKILVQVRAHADKIQFFANDILSCEACTCGLDGLQKQSTLGGANVQ